MATILSKIYSSKWGIIEIFNRDNYPSFARDCKAALVAAGAWSIVNGTELRPQTAQVRADWEKRRGFALQIIFSSTDKAHKGRIDSLIDTSDVVGIWDKLKQSDRSRDAVYISKVRDQFQAEALDVTTTSIRKFVSILEHYRDQIAGTDSPITDVEMRNRLLNALPSDPLWQNSKM